jgi:hypothetical protein
MKSKVKSMLIIFFTFTKNSSWQAKQSIPHTTMTLYGDCVKMCKEFVPKFGDKRTGCCITKMQLPFSLGNFCLKTAWLSTLSVFPIWDKTDRLAFDTTEAIEAESQAVLNTLTEHIFQKAFKKMTEGLGTVHGLFVVRIPVVLLSLIYPNDYIWNGILQGILYSLLSVKPNSLLYGLLDY